MLLPIPWSQALRRQHLRTIGGDPSIDSENENRIEADIEEGGNHHHNRRRLWVPNRTGQATTNQRDDKRRRTEEPEIDVERNQRCHLSVRHPSNVGRASPSGPSQPRG